MIGTPAHGATTGNPASQTLFTTQTPASIGQSDGAGMNYELGTLFQSNTAGQITAVRFWKDASETGTHIGNIWSSTGQLLASVTFANETASGWQQQALTTSISIAANTTYVVSVNTGSAFYVATIGGLSSQMINGNLSSVVGNDGVYGTAGTFPTSSWQTSNYFRDVVFVPDASYSISGRIGPLENGPGTTVTLSGAASATATADSSGSYTFTDLANGNYTVTPTKAGFTFSPTSAPASVNNGDVTVASFTATANAADQTLFTTQIPAQLAQSDSASVNYELGTLFQSNTTGLITSIRFWKDVNETGTHTGRLWSATGQLLASVVFVSEIASGWQQQALTAPLAIAANTAYVVSVNTGNTYYVTTASGLASQVINGNLSSVIGNNGMYGPTGAFPANSWQTSNYFRDVVFVPDATTYVAPTTLVLNGSSSALNFGSVNVSSSSGQNVTLTNAGISNVTISNVSISGAGFGASGVPTGLILSAGQTATLVVTFTPAATGSVTGSVTVTSNATNSPDQIALSGIGVATVVHSASLSWTPSTSTVIGYNCYSSAVSGGPYGKLNTLPVAATSYTDTTVQSGMTYYYVVTSVDSNNGESVFPSEVSAIIP